jgi:hypothetical protein
VLLSPEDEPPADVLESPAVSSAASVVLAPPRGQRWPPLFNISRRRRGAAPAALIPAWFASAEVEDDFLIAALMLPPHWQPRAHATLLTALAIVFEVEREFRQRVASSRLPPPRRRFAARS